MADTYIYVIGKDTHAKTQTYAVVASATGAVAAARTAPGTEAKALILPRADGLRKAIRVLLAGTHDAGPPGRSHRSRERHLEKVRRFTVTKPIEESFWVDLPGKVTDRPAHHHRLVLQQLGAPAQLPQLCHLCHL